MQEVINNKVKAVENEKQVLQEQLMSGRKEKEYWSEKAREYSAQVCLANSAIRIVPSD